MAKTRAQPKKPQPTLAGRPLSARVALFEELLKEGADEVERSAFFWNLAAPRTLRGAARTYFLAGKVVEAEIPAVAPIVALTA